MLATIVKADLKESTEQWPNPDTRGNRKYWMTLDFRPHGVVPDFGGIGSNNDGTTRGQMGFKTYNPVPGAVIDVDVRPNERGTCLNFKRIQAQGVPMNGHAQTNGHAAPVGVRSQPSSPTAPQMGRVTFLLFLARYGVGLGLMGEVYKEHFPGLTEAERAKLSRDAIGPFVVEWLKGEGCDMPDLMDGGMKAYQAEDGDAQTDSVPF
jgi:hypothetical protein